MLRKLFFMLLFPIALQAQDTLNVSGSFEGTIVAPDLYKMIYDTTTVIDSTETPVIRSFDWGHKASYTSDDYWLYAEGYTFADSVRIEYTTDSVFTSRNVIPQGNRVVDSLHSVILDSISITMTAWLDSVAYDSTVWVDTQILDDIKKKESDMSQFFTDFSEYSTGAAPSDFSAEFNAGNNSTLEVVDNAGTNELELVISTSDRCYWSWDDVGSVSGTVQLYIKTRITSGSDGQINLANRMSGTEGSETGHRASLSESSDIQHYDKYVDGANTRVQQVSSPTGIVDGDVWHILSEVESAAGTDRFKMKIWEDGETEPASWAIDTADSDLNADTSGVVGFGAFNAATYHILELGVGTGGDAAPREAVGGGTTEVSFSLNTTQNASSSSTSIAESSVSLNANQDISEGSDGIGESTLTLDSLLGLTSLSDAVAEGSFSLPAVHAVSTVADTQVVNEASFALALSKAISTQQISTILVDYSLGTSQSVSTQSVSVAESVMSVDFNAAMSLLSVSLAEAGISFNAIQSVTLSAQTVGVEVTLADGRTLTIKLQNRSYSIDNDNRTFTINQDNRTYNIE